MLEHSVAKSDIFDWLCLYFGKQCDNYKICNLYPASVYRMNITRNSCIPAEIDQIKYFGEIGEQVINFNLKNIQQLPYLLKLDQNQAQTATEPVEGIQ